MRGMDRSLGPSCGCLRYLGAARQARVERLRVMVRCFLEGLRRVMIRIQSYNNRCYGRATDDAVTLVGVNVNASWTVAWIREGTGTAMRSAKAICNGHEAWVSGRRRNWRFGKIAALRQMRKISEELCHVDSSDNLITRQNSPRTLV